MFLRKTWTVMLKVKKSSSPIYIVCEKSVEDGEEEGGSFSRAWCEEIICIAECKIHHSPKGGNYMQYIHIHYCQSLKERDVGDDTTILVNYLCIKIFFRILKANAK